MVFGVVVSPVFRASVPVITKLVLGSVATEPPVAHIHHFGPAGNNCFIGNTCNSWVICLDRGFWLRPPHRDEGLPVKNYLSSCDKKGCKFRFCGWCHNNLDDLGNWENNTVEMQKWIVLWEEDVCSGMAVRVSLIEKSCIRVGTQDYVTRSIDDAVRRIGSNII